MHAKMNLTLKLLAFGDEKTSSNPRLRYVDWTRDLSGLSVSDPKSEAHRLEAGATKIIFDGTRAVTIDGTTTFSLSLITSIDGAQRYRITHTGGTNPGFRTSRAVAGTGVLFTLTALANGTLNVVAGSSIFGSVQVGDTVFIPNTTTGDSVNVFSVLNSGFWQVSAANSGTNIVLVRPTGADFEGVSESVTPTSNTQFRVFSTAGVQSGDTVEISAGFAPVTQKSFIVDTVTDSFIEILSSIPLPNQTGVIPTATGMSFYTETKRLVYLESSQELVVRTNGDAGNTQRTASFDPTDPAKPGVYLKLGPVWSLAVVNRNSVAAEITLIHAE
jgi:hypothetical protein